MKKEIRKIITLAKAAPNLKSQIISAIIALLAGIMLEITTAYYSNSIAGGICIINSILFIHQSIMITSGTGLAQSSPSAKKLQTIYPLLKLPVYIITFVIVSIHRLYLVNNHLQDIPIKDSSAAQCSYILCFSTTCFFFLMLENICYKHLILGCICMIPAAAPIIINAVSYKNNFDIFYHISIKSSIAIGFLIIIAGSLLAFLVANLFYKHPISAHFMKLNYKV